MTDTGDLIPYVCTPNSQCRLLVVGLEYVLRFVLTSLGLQLSHAFRMMLALLCLYAPPAQTAPYQYFP
jgi:hypothetical protein